MLERKAAMSKHAACLLLLARLWGTGGVSWEKEFKSYVNVRYFNTHLYTTLRRYMPCSCQLTLIPTKALHKNAQMMRYVRHYRWQADDGSSHNTVILLGQVQMPTLPSKEIKGI